MKLKDVLVPVVDEAKAIVGLFPTGAAAREKEPLNDDELAEYNQNQRILLIAKRMGESAQDTIEIPDGDVARVRNNIRRFAFGGTDLNANPDFDKWLNSLLKK